VPHKLGQTKLGFGGLVFRLRPLSTTAPAASKNMAHINSGQKQLENNSFASLE